MPTATGPADRAPTSTWAENLDGAAVFPHLKPWKSTAPPMTWLCDLALDADEDGDQDALAAWDAGGHRWYENPDGSGQFGPHFHQYPTSDNTCLIDVDGDGDQDLISTQRQPPKVIWTEHKDGGFSLRAQHFDHKRILPGIQCKDFDNDGDADDLSATSEIKN
ncbi:MAG: VCBS repeat-containing protein [Saprospirales bacterium]|nr:VCBS repeat-containing protein [Saprospirales bacterium]